jgi:hypothetical protein
MPAATGDPERPYEQPESGPLNGLRREHRYSLIELIATNDRKTAAAVERTIPQSILLPANSLIR